VRYINFDFSKENSGRKSTFGTIIALATFRSAVLGIQVTIKRSKSEKVSIEPPIFTQKISAISGALRR
jgi:hypothetical protein